MVPGEYEENTRRRREAEGIAIEEGVWREIAEAAEALGVVLPRPMS